MLRCNRLVSVVLASLLVAVNGCGGDVADSSDDASDTWVNVDAGDTNAADTVASWDPEFVLGINLDFQASPVAFVPLAAGDELEVELGFQGLWMVALAFKQRGLVDGLVYLSASITIDGQVRGELQLTDQPMFAGPDSWQYHYNFFLVVDEPETAPGHEATIIIAGVDETGGRFEHSLLVNLIEEVEQ